MAVRFSDVVFVMAKLLFTQDRQEVMQQMPANDPCQVTGQMYPSPHPQGHPMTQDRQEVMQMPRGEPPAIVSDQHDRPDTPSMLALAVERGMSPEVIGQLIAHQERIDAGSARKAFDQAVADAKAMIPIVAKNRNGHNDKRYADFAAIARIIDPIISRYGLTYRFRTHQDDRIHVTCILSHRDGHSEETTLAGPADATGNKNAIQAIGSTLTYLQRYSLTQMLGLAASDDDDGKAVGAGETITEEQVQELSMALTNAKIPLAPFLKTMKVAALSEIPASQMAYATATIAEATAIRAQKKQAAPA